ncbi:hypothetical protein Pan216_51200 [Planctomycetes bacterium Pan216]|uniref:4-O-methyl-glucuronoyl methylesterase-like domain-containing protein n=1 Tax=Kolteria novifilia TaxID=2527975 RepID=A0A518BB67_9BACT|nr:hypothetical protein Pan216_51200 [Planctomycetes bacterium Pan216]
MNRTLTIVGLSYCLLHLSLSTAISAPPDANYDEAKVPEYTLPDPLVAADGASVDDPAEWISKRRPEILELFKTHVYGRSPDAPKRLQYELTSIDRQALGGKATRKEIAIKLGDAPNAPSMNLLLYLPNDVSKPVPVFLGLNFKGNHTIHSDPGITLSEVWSRPSKGRAGEKKRGSEKSRGTSASRWPVETIIDRGYGLGTIYYGDIDPDFHDGFKNGVHPHHDKHESAERPADAWGSIAAWAWGLSRAMDYFERDDDVDQKKVAVLGHSRLGKTSLWAGATDPRFALVISNDSGCGGAALSRRRFGEKVKRINTSFPHWFCGNFDKYNDNEAALPVDQHMLIALIAPRPVYIASAAEDQWADPRGEFLSGLHADPVYRLLGTDGIATKEMPKVDQPSHSAISYHVRTGKHDLTAFDWGQYLDRADTIFQGSATPAK